MLLAAFTAVTYVLIDKLKVYSGLYLSLLLLLGFGYEGYIHLQFTKTGGFSTAAAVFLMLYALFREDIHPWEILYAVLLGVLGYMYRPDQFFASGALMAGAGIYFLLNMRGRFHKKMRKRLGTVLGAFVLLFAAVFAVDRWDASQYQSPEWKEYQEFNQLRSQLLDYGFPDYESNKELYKELGISKEALELYKTWNFNDRKYGDPFLKTLPGRSVKTADVLLLCSIFAFVDIFRKEESKSTTLDSTGLAAGNAAHQVIHKQWQKMEYKIHTKM